MKDHDTYLKRGALTLGAVAIAGYLADYGFNLGLTRFLSPHDYGDFKVAVAFASFFGLAVLLGGDRAAPRFLAPCLERGEAGKVWAYLRFYLGWAVLLSFGLIAVTWTLAVWHVGSAHPEHHHPLAWVVIAVPLNAVAAMVSRTLQSSQRPAEAAMPWRIGLPLAQLALFAAVVGLGGTLGLAEAVAIGIVATAVLTAWQWGAVRRYGLVDLAGDPAFHQPRQWLGSSLPMMGAFLAALALNQSDLYFLEILGDDAEVGHYAAAATVAHFVTLVQVTVVSLIAPIAGSAIEDGAEASRATFRRGLAMMAGFAVPVAVALAAAAGPVLGVFGPEYRSGVTTLELLVVGNLAWALAALSALWLQYRGRGRSVLGISLATLAVDSLLNLVLIPRYGMTGAAAGTALTLTLAAAVVVAQGVPAALRRRQR
jgi:O-antigen/teichoic acid export membrane protein